MNHALADYIGSLADQTVGVDNEVKRSGDVDARELAKLKWKCREFLELPVIAAIDDSEFDPFTRPEPPAIAPESEKKSFIRQIPGDGWSVTFEGVRQSPRWNSYGPAAAFLGAVVDGSRKPEPETK